MPQDSGQQDPSGQVIALHITRYVQQMRKELNTVWIQLDRRQEIVGYIRNEDWILHDTLQDTAGL
jgi:hypothetical protein